MNSESEGIVYVWATSIMTQKLANFTFPDHAALHEIVE